MTELFRKIYWVMSAQFGINPRLLFRSIRGVGGYFLDLLRFRRAYKGELVLMPCLHDKYEEGGASKNEYFLQDLWVAQRIFGNQPQRHVDVGSRLDGFIAHVASFREIEVFDIRPITSRISGVVFNQADMMSPNVSLSEYCDSLSCLHALEHFGLGRYGDPLDVNGYISGLSNMAKILKMEGVLYLSVPVGQPRVEFNANRVFDPLEVCQLADKNGLKLVEFAWIEGGKDMFTSQDIQSDLLKLKAMRYALGIFTFKKEKVLP